MNTIFYIGNEDVMSALKFAEEATFGNSQSKRDFGSSDMRNKLDQIADISEGKIAEIGFSRFLKENFNISTEVDLKHYADVKGTDFGNDIESLFNCIGEARTCTFKVDVKTTKPYSKWLLVESHKFWANAYVLIKTALPRGTEQDPYANIKGSVKVEVVGFAYYTDFIDSETKKPWIEYSRGDCLVYPEDLEIDAPVKIKDLYRDSSIRRMGFPLKSNSNYGLPAYLLRNSKDEWGSLISKVIASIIDAEDQLMSRRI